MPASETVDFEREFAELVRELRAVPSEAPEELRERVRALGEPAPRRVFRFPTLSRRALFVLAPACVVALVAGALLYSVFTPSSTQRESFGRRPGPATSTTLRKQVQQRGVRAAAPAPARDHAV